MKGGRGSGRKAGEGGQRKQIVGKGTWVIKQRNVVAVRYEEINTNRLVEQTSGCSVSLGAVNT